MIRDARNPMLPVAALPNPGARAPRLVDVPPAAEERFRAQHVVVVGGGGIGGRIAVALARAGVRDLLVVDPAEIKRESLLTHEVGPGDVGRPKAALVARRARALGADLRVRFACASFQELPLDSLVGVDAVVLASDNLAAELAVGTACRRFGVRLIHASLYGPTLTGQVRSLANDDPHGPCLACAWAEDDWRRLDEGTRFACVVTDGPAAPARTTIPTRTTIELCAVTAGLAVAELRRRSFGADTLPALAPDVLVEWSGYRLDTVTSPVEARAACPAAHGRWRTSELPGLGAVTPRELLARAGAARPEQASLEIEGHAYDPDAAGLARGGNGWREIPAEALEADLDLPLARLLAGHDAAVVVRVDGAAPVLFHRPSTAPHHGEQR